MHYQSETIATVIKRLNINYFLPAIQREYVWHPEQIIQLFDSIMRNYPISTFLFWEVEAKYRYKWDVYEFVQNYKQDETHNEPASTDGVQQLTLVLDGQQRLTSMLIGLKGTYTIKKKYLRWDSPGAWVKQSLYLDLFKLWGQTSRTRRLLPPLLQRSEILQWPMAEAIAVELLFVTISCLLSNLSPRRRSHVN